MKSTEHKPAGFDRRRFLTSSVAVTTAMCVSGTVLINVGEGWGLEAKGLKPETMKTLIMIARDIYPHDQLADKFYAIAMKTYDSKAANDPNVKSMIEDSVSKIDTLAQSKHQVAYAEIATETDRVTILREIEGTPFFQMVRSGMIVGLYNQHEIWPIFGYEGESASQGGYIRRGFNDLAWL